MNKTQSTYKYLPFLAMAYISIMICSDLLVNKRVSMVYGYTTAATLIFPFWFIINDVIAEVYGYKLCRNILLAAFAIQLFFDLICYLAIHLPSPSDWKNQAAFDLVLGHLIRIAVGTLSAYVIGGLINIHLLTKWKALMSGKHFLLRCIGSSAIAEAFYSALNVWAILLGSLPASKIAMIMCWSYTLKIVFTLVMAYPAMLLVRFLKNAEGVDAYDKVSYEKMIWAARSTEKTHI